MAWHGMVWYGMVWYGMVWYGMVYAHEMRALGSRVGISCPVCVRLGLSDTAIEILLKASEERLL